MCAVSVCRALLQVEGTLVAAGTLGLLRLCQRLLPCKPEAAELLLRGLQLVPSVDPEVSAVSKPQHLGRPKTLVCVWTGCCLTVASVWGCCGCMPLSQLKAGLYGYGPS